MDMDKRPDLVVAEHLDRSPRKYGAIVCAVLSICVGADGMDVMLPSYMIVGFDHYSSLEKGIIVAASVVGSTLGSLMQLYYSDRSGRKTTIIISMILAFLGGAATSFANDIYSLALLRFVCGIGIGAGSPSIWALGSEIFRTEDRGKYLSIMACTYSLFVAILSLLAWFILGDDIHGVRIYPAGQWRLLVLLGTAPSGLVVPFAYFFLPESPRHLLEQGKTSKVAFWLSKISGNKNVQMIEASITAPPTHKLNKSTRQSSGASSRTGLLGLIKNAPSRKLLIRMCAIWYLYMYAVFGIFVWIPYMLNSTGYTNTYLTAVFSSLCMLPGNVATLFLINRVLRRNLLRVAFISITIAGALLTLAMSGTVFPKTEFFLSIPAGLFMSCAVLLGNTLNTVSPENLPTAMRSDGVALFLTIGRCGNITSQLVNTYLAAGMATLLCALGTFALALGVLLTFSISLGASGKILEKGFDGHTAPQNEKDRRKNISK